MFIHNGHIWSWTFYRRRSSGCKVDVNDRDRVAISWKVSLSRDSSISLDLHHVLFRSKSVTVTLKLHEPEIILVTNVKSRDADAILFGMELTLQYDMVPDGTRQMVGILDYLLIQDIVCNP